MHQRLGNSSVVARITWEPRRAISPDTSAMQILTYTPSSVRANISAP